MIPILRIVFLLDPRSNMPNNVAAPGQFQIS